MLQQLQQVRLLLVPDCCLAVLMKSQPEGGMYSMFHHIHIQLFISSGDQLHVECHHDAKRQAHFDIGVTPAGWWRTDGAAVPYSWWCQHAKAGFG